MRTVNLKVTATIMVPIVVNYTVVAKVDEGIPMERVAIGAICGKGGRGFTVEDSAFDVVSVDGADVLEIEGCDLDEQVGNYIEGDDSPTPKYVSHEVTDSR